MKRVKDFLKRNMRFLFFLCLTLTAVTVLANDTCRSYLICEDCYAHDPCHFCHQPSVCYTPGEPIDFICVSEEKRCPVPVDSHLDSIVLTIFAIMVCLVFCCAFELRGSCSRCRREASLF